MPTIEDAIILATGAHRGQVDKAGIPYILHPLRVASMFLLPIEDSERVVSVLHDIVEDTSITLEELTNLGYPDHIVKAIDAISWRVRFEEYHKYIERVLENHLATKVKMADLRDNLDDRRLSTSLLSPETKKKYSNAYARLMNGEAKIPIREIGT